MNTKAYFVIQCEEFCRNSFPAKGCNQMEYTEVFTSFLLKETVK